MTISRRHFLQFAASTLATLGLSQFDIQRQGLRYARVLAQPTPRKLALLVGINKYDHFGNDLQGCVTDVDLQRELLVHRFGFNPTDIKVLSDTADDKPTRENILTAFNEHLIKQAQFGDVVVFHFSGHGSRVVDPTPVSNAIDSYNSTFVPMDAAGNAEGIPDIMGKTLFLLMSALARKTEHITAVLDCCYSGGGTRGNVRIRSVRNGSDGQDAKVSPIELEYQQQWLSQLSMSPEDFAQQRDRSVKGVMIAAAQRDQEAADATFNQFDAGVFTYFLTQYLWQQTDAAVSSAVASVSRSIQVERFAQVPFPDIQVNSGFEQKPIYFVDRINTTQAPPAEAVLIESNGGRGSIWLGGIDPASLAAFDVGATFTIAGTDEQGAQNIKLLSRQGLMGEVQLSGAIAPGTLLQEAARAIPRDLKLRIGLDPSLEADAAQAQQALQAIRRIEPVPSQSGNTPYAGEVQYILTRMTANYHRRLQGAANLPEVGSIGLVSQSIDEIIPNSFDKAGERVEDAIARLSSKLTALVAARIIKLTLNANSSRLNLEASMQREDTASAIIGKAFTVRGSHRPSTETPNDSRQLPVNTPFQFRIANQESSDLYISILVVDPSGEITVLFPNQYGAAADTTRIGAKQTLTVPDPAKDSFQFATESQGVGEALIIASRSPLRQALLALRNLAAEQQLPQRGAFVTPSVEAIGDLLSDLSGDRGNNTSTGNSPILRTSEIAALSITFAVV